MTTLREMLEKPTHMCANKRVFTIAEAEARRHNHPSGQVISHTFWTESKKWVFFTNDHCFGVYILEGVVPCSSYLPYKIVARPGFEDGMLKNVDEFIRLHHADSTIIEDMDTLIEVLMDNPQFLTDATKKELEFAEYCS